MSRSVPARDHGHERYDYWRYAGRDWRWFEPILDRMHPASPVLDVGCGLGFFAECCRRHGIEAVGVELSLEGVAGCRARGVPVVRADLAVPFPFRDEAFGSALAHHVLEHVPLEVERSVLREIHRVLRPGGFLFAISPNTHHPRAREDPDHRNLFTPHALAGELHRAGFTRVSLATNYWLPVWDRQLQMGRLGSLLAGILWKIAPVDRFAASASALAWR
ncbi:MAG TPA: class I SAM-dependent methyltransferase [Thermoplasmata archaeon]|nr:class I SAM-dependent methyltransferase [Thermoplasmata archaeon]